MEPLSTVTQDNMLTDIEKGIVDTGKSKEGAVDCSTRTRDLDGEGRHGDGQGRDMNGQGHDNDGPKTSDVDGTKSRDVDGAKSRDVDGPKNRDVVVGGQDYSSRDAVGGRGYVGAGHDQTVMEVRKCHHLSSSAHGEVSFSSPSYGTLDMGGSVEQTKHVQGGAPTSFLVLVMRFIVIVIPVFLFALFFSWSMGTVFDRTVAFSGLFGAPTGTEGNFRGGMETVGGGNSVLQMKPKVSREALEAGEPLKLITQPFIVEGGAPSPLLANEGGTHYLWRKGVTRMKSYTKLDWQYLAAEGGKTFPWKGLPDDLATELPFVVDLFVRIVASKPLNSVETFGSLMGQTWMKNVDWGDENAKYLVSLMSNMVVAPAWSLTATMQRLKTLEGLSKQQCDVLVDCQTGKEKYKDRVQKLRETLDSAGKAFVTACNENDVVVGESVAKAFFAQNNMNFAGLKQIADLFVEQNDGFCSEEFWQMWSKAAVDRIAMEEVQEIAEKDKRVPSKREKANGKEMGARFHRIRTELLPITSKIKQNPEAARREILAGLLETAQRQDFNELSDELGNDGGKYLAWKNMGEADWHSVQHVFLSAVRVNPGIITFFRGDEDSVFRKFFEAKKFDECEQISPELAPKTDDENAPKTDANNVAAFEKKFIDDHRNFRKKVARSLAQNAPHLVGPIVHLLTNEGGALDVEFVTKLLQEGDMAWTLWSSIPPKYYTKDLVERIMSHLETDAFRFFFDVKREGNEAAGPRGSSLQDKKTGAGGGKKNKRNGKKDREIVSVSQSDISRRVNSFGIYFLFQKAFMVRAALVEASNEKEKERARAGDGFVKSLLDNLGAADGVMKKGSEGWVDAKPAPWHTDLLDCIANGEAGGRSWNIEKLRQTFGESVVGLTEFMEQLGEHQ